MCIACTINKHWIPLLIETANAISETPEKLDEIKSDFYKQHTFDQEAFDKMSAWDAAGYKSQCLPKEKLDEYWAAMVEDFKYRLFLQIKDKF